MTPTSSREPDARKEFVMVPNWLHGVVAVRHIGVYAGLRAFDVPGGQCNPTEAEVAHLVGVSASTVKRAVRDLVAAKALRLQDRRRGTRNTYTFPSRKGQSFSKVPVALLGQVPIGTVGVYCVLRSFDGPNGCYPAIATVAQRAGLSHTAAQDALRTLRAVGAIEVAPRYKPGGAPTSNVYRFPDLLQQTSHSADGDVEDVRGEHEWGHSPGVGEVMMRVPVGSPAGHELENLTRDSDQEQVGRCPPPAVSPPQIRENRTTAINHDQVEVGQPRHPVSGISNERFNADGLPIVVPWYHHPFDDTTLERQVWDLVNLLAEELNTLSGKNKPSQTTQDAWARTVRVMLAHDHRDVDKVGEIIRNACVDRSWSKAIHSMYDVAKHWDRLVETFNKRAPRRFEPRAEEMVTEFDLPPVDWAKATLGGRGLSDLPDWEPEPNTSGESAIKRLMSLRRNIGGS